MYIRTRTRVLNLYIGFFSMSLHLPTITTHQSVYMSLLMASVGSKTVVITAHFSQLFLQVLDTDRDGVNAAGSAQNEWHILIILWDLIELYTATGITLY